MAEKPRILQNRRDMVLTMVPLIALCLLVLIASGNFKLGFGADPKDETVDPINPRGVYQVSAENLGFPVRMPGGTGVVDGVPEGWKATATRDDDVVGGKVFSVNYVTPEKNSLQLSQSGAPADVVIESVYGAKATPSGSVPVEGRTWEVYGPNDKNRSAWVLRVEGAVIIVFGGGTVPRFTELAAAVQSQEPLPRSAAPAPAPR
ncbi:DUF4245 domain-containing protein [Tsukamurella paurometabola]|uniref:DUF4245 domain-containing protein n=1 Tax=Tsukamurella paurometabola TaxID=2061 RepID=A0A3P8M9Q5_TSUPA|nr:DUF4245 domain-containing protein [Tsukamurella paurometabola]MBS4101730.1 DUF4245 domain-containing protein [Tsukamurella paurometabola]UEA84748.1 DUF4245 domain-containing protein [Tsukamurella paurometabola]VDR37330.1 Uncharacterised protein [Tsukamurella paurometabola]